MASKDPRHNLRLSTDLKLKLAKAAFDNGRSVNAEILSRLEKSFRPAPSFTADEIFEVISAIDEKHHDEIIRLMAVVGAIIARHKAGAHPDVKVATQARDA